ncbi:hypothetical protein KP509_28G004300 [Ceratopteris richardii]|uniref:eIF-4F 25 kDa subunit n=1 Tax=Ceratopteris richardii TaxID=49495 RepID=A0A8T2RB94_CERRI|nr:hypothetical protein KP509_28G004300 [Ceratopteris richardii]
MAKADEAEELEEGEIPRPPKHRLERAWTFWYDNYSAKSKQKTWGSSLRLVYTFSTVEDFWGIYNNVIQPSQLANGADFHCFKAGIEPKWEDPICARGGKWSITFSKGKSATTDTFWLYTVLAMIGEQFNESDEICGAVVSIRTRLEKLALWTKTASNEAAQMSIGKQWKDLLDYHDKIGFIAHEDAIRDDKSAKNKYNA